MSTMIGAAFSDGGTKSLLRVIDRGLSEFAVVHQEQKSLVESKRKRVFSEDVLILVEHPAVYTIGRGFAYSSHQKDMVEVERGGLATFHNPGQLVAYPILHLRSHNLTGYLRKLEDVLIALLAEYCIGAERRPGFTGVWVSKKGRKIASIGIACRGWVTYHGCALNVCNDLSGFRSIQPCGFDPLIMTSMALELRCACPDMREVKRAFVRHFEKVFGCRSLSR